MINNIFYLSINEFKLNIYNMKKYPFNFLFDLLSSLVYLLPLLIGIKRVDGIEQLLSISFMPIVMSLGLSDKINELREKGIIEQLITGRYSFTEYIFANFVNSIMLSLVNFVIILSFTKASSNVNFKLINIVFLIFIFSIAHISLEFLFLGLLLRFKKLGMLLGIIKFIIAVMFFMPFGLLSENFVNIISLIIPLTGGIAYAQSLSGRFMFSYQGVCFMILNTCMFFIISFVSYKKLYNKTRKHNGLSHY